MADPVWLMVMFDLPVKTKAAQRAANQYRNALLDLGFERVQLSVYAKYFLNATGTARTISQVKAAIPANGVVRILRISDAVWSSAIRYENAVSVDVEPAPAQLELFGF